MIRKFAFAVAIGGLVGMLIGSIYAVPLLKAFGIGALSGVTVGLFYQFLGGVAG